MIVFFLVLFYLACALYGWGSAMADFSVVGIHPRYYCGTCAVIALMGPFGAVVALFATNFNQHGWKLWSKPQ